MSEMVERVDDCGFFYVEWIGEPCPFCGGKGVSGKSPEGHFFAGCDDPDCLAHMLAYDFVTVDHARAAWNTRAPIMAETANDNRTLPTLKCRGVARVQDNPRSVEVIFSRRLTDDELRFFHEVCERSAPLRESPHG